MGTTVNSRRVLAILNKDSTYPYTSSKPLSGIAIINTGDVAMVVVANGISIPVPRNSTYDADLGTFNTVNVTTPSSEFYIELRG